MLKVNTDQIRVDEFAKKYGFEEMQYHYYKRYEDSTYAIDIYVGKDTAGILIVPRETGIQLSDPTVSDIYDMIISGDVIKKDE